LRFGRTPMERTLSEPLVVENPLGSEPETAENSAPKEDKAKAPKTKRVPKEGGKTKSEPRSKRGPPRPYRKLSQEILDQRIKKLQKRLERCTAQAEEAGGFLSKYVREQGYRHAEKSAAPQA